MFLYCGFVFRKSQEKMNQSHMVDLLDVNLGGDPTPADPWGMPQPPRPQVIEAKQISVKKIDSVC